MSDERSKGGRPADKLLSNPFSTGSGGPRFEFQVQAAFATLMLAGGFVPCLPCMPIKSIKQQARHAGYRTDDLVVTIGGPTGSETRRLLIQVKHGISFTRRDVQFRDTIAAAWRDFNDTAIFTRRKDAIAIVSGPLAASDVEDTRRILEWARDQVSAQEFFRNIAKANFSSKKKQNKLAAFRAHIDAAAGTKASDEETFEFLRHIYILSYDLDVRTGMMHALLHSIIGRHRPDNPASLFSQVFEHVCSSNSNAGTLTEESFSDEIRDAFRERAVESMPSSLTSPATPPVNVNWNASKFADALAVATLVGAWNEQSPADMAVVGDLTQQQPSDWLRLMREVLQQAEPPIRYDNGVWAVKNRRAMWASLAPRIFNSTLAAFKDAALLVLRERNPAFDLDPNDRFAAQIYGKSLSHSAAIRLGITETLALLGTSDIRLPHCPATAGEDSATTVIRDLLEGADWQLWASLDRHLPTLAEASPDAFLNSSEETLRRQPCPFDALFAQEGSGISGGTYICGLLWALEALAWSETYLVRAAVILAMLASRDPGGNWSNRPANSLTSIFLPWFPQTRASLEKREVAVRAIVRERREVGWQLLIRLMPSYHGTTTGTYKPKWRNPVDEDPAST